MRRIRIALALVSLAALGLVAVLAWRASQGIAAERAARHEAVAERTFEEMERALTAFLAREEERPVEHYAPAPGGGAPAPLASGLEPFVVGAFQVDLQGVVTTPLEPAADETARVAAARVRRVVGGLWANGADAFGAAPPRARRGEGPKRDDAALAKRENAGRLEAEPQTKESGVLEQAPGTTRALSGPGVEAADELAEAERPERQREARNAFDLLESLNRSADYRAERKQKVAQAPKSAVYGGREPIEASAPVAEEESAGEPSAASDRAFRAESVAPQPRRSALGDAASGGLAEADAAPRPATPAAAAPRPATPAAAAPPERPLGAALRVQEPAPEPEEEAVRVAIDPMVGVAVGDDLVLYRTVLVGQGGFRQGLVLDRAALGAWLDARVIVATGLSGLARVSFAEAAAPASGGYVFAHRFAEPFDALRATLALASLPGVASPVALHALVGVLLAVGAAGLVAVHRTASVVVSYAERRSNFAAAVSHELKTPLTAIRMYAEMLRDGLVSGEEKRDEYYATITDESERLSRLVDNVLEFSKLEGGRRELRVAAGAVGPVLEEVAEKLRAHAAREGFAIVVSVEPDLPAVRFDRDALLQVLFNLVDNAMKYAKTSDTRRIEIAAARDAEGDGVGVSVRDFGPGVPPGHQARIFEPFYRGESELTRTTKGTGIGLALVKELAERMGAAVQGANAADGGFRVRLAFPRP